MSSDRRNSTSYSKNSSARNVRSSDGNRDKYNKQIKRNSEALPLPVANVSDDDDDVVYLGTMSTQTPQKDTYNIPDDIVYIGTITTETIKEPDDVIYIGTSTSDSSTQSSQKRKAYNSPTEILRTKKFRYDENLSEISESRHKHRNPLEENDNYKKRKKPDDYERNTQEEERTVIKTSLKEVENSQSKRFKSSFTEINNVFESNNKKLEANLEKLPIKFDKNSKKCSDDERNLKRLPNHTIGQFEKDTMDGYQHLAGSQLKPPDRLKMTPKITPSHKESMKDSRDKGPYDDQYKRTSYRYDDYEYRKSKKESHRESSRKFETSTDRKSSLKSRENKNDKDYKKRDDKDDKKRHDKDDKKRDEERNSKPKSSSVNTNDKNSQETEIKSNKCKDLPKSSKYEKEKKYASQDKKGNEDYQKHNNSKIFSQKEKTIDKTKSATTLEKYKKISKGLMGGFKKKALNAKGEQPAKPNLVTHTENLIPITQTTASATNTSVIFTTSNENMNSHINHKNNPNENKSILDPEKKLLNVNHNIPSSNSSQYSEKSQIPNTIVSKTSAGSEVYNGSYISSQATTNISTFSLNSLTEVISHNSRNYITTSVPHPPTPPKFLLEGNFKSLFPSFPLHINFDFSNSSNVTNFKPTLTNNSNSPSSGSHNTNHNLQNPSAYQNNMNIEANIQNSNTVEKTQTNFGINTENSGQFHRNYENSPKNNLPNIMKGTGNIDEISSVLTSPNLLKYPPPVGNGNSIINGFETSQQYAPNNVYQNSVSQNSGSLQSLNNNVPSSQLFQNRFDVGNYTNALPPQGNNINNNFQNFRTLENFTQQGRGGEYVNDFNQDSKNIQFGMKKRYSQNHRNSTYHKNNDIEKIFNKNNENFNINHPPPFPPPQAQNPNFYKINPAPPVPDLTKPPPPLPPHLRPHNNSGNCRNFHTSHSNQFDAKGKRQPLRDQNRHVKYQERSQHFGSFQGKNIRNLNGKKGIDLRKVPPRKFSKPNLKNKSGTKFPINSKRIPIINDKSKRYPRPAIDPKKTYSKKPNQYSKLLKKVKIKYNKDPTKIKTKESKKSKKLKKKSSETSKTDHIDVNKETFGEFKPIKAGLKKPPKGHLKPNPEIYWKEWWSIYGYVEKYLTPIDPSDASIKTALNFTYPPSHKEFRKRKRQILVTGVTKMLSHIKLNETDYALRDIFSVLKYKHKLEDVNFQQHLNEKERDRVEKVLKQVRKKTRRAFFCQNMMCRWHFSSLILKSAEAGEGNLKCAHARKLMNDKAFNYLVAECVKELKVLISEDWPGFDEFYKSLQ